MKKDKKKEIKEPYEPQDTPKPPQIIDPNTRRDRENPVEGGGRTDSRPEKTGHEKSHLLQDDADIDDETTI